MLRVPLEQIEMGMKLALPVFNPTSPGRVLLKPGFEMEKKTIDRLREFKVNEIWIHYPGLEMVDRFVKPELMKQKAELASAINEVFGLACRETAPRLSFATYAAAIGKLVAEILANPATALFLEEFDATSAPLQSHCMRVAYLSVLLGAKLDAYLITSRKRLSPHRAQEVTNLGLGAMLHDVGVARLPEGTRQQYEQTGDPSDPKWQEHVRLGYDLVGDQIPPSARAVILHHHQAFDGSGFPASEDLNGNICPLKGDQIHVFARIAAVANAYDRLVHPVVGDACPPVYALRELLCTDLRNKFDPVVLAGLIKVAPAYPPGTIVLLSDGRKATAVDHNPDDPCRPKVQVLGSEIPKDDAAAGDSVTLVDLTLEPNIHVAKVGDDDVSQFNFDPPKLAAA